MSFFGGYPFWLDLVDFKGSPKGKPPLRGPPKKTHPRSVAALWLFGDGFLDYWTFWLKQLGTNSKKRRPHNCCHVSRFRVVFHSRNRVHLGTWHHQDRPSGDLGAVWLECVETIPFAIHVLCRGPALGRQHASAPRSQSMMQIQGCGSNIDAQSGSPWFFGGNRTNTCGFWWSNFDPYLHF